ncbi:hypothetical protein WAI453_002433 [Rhynchosporium graminicola]
MRMKSAKLKLAGTSVISARQHFRRRLGDFERRYKFLSESAEDEVEAQEEQMHEGVEAPCHTATDADSDFSNSDLAMVGGDERTVDGNAEFYEQEIVRLDYAGREQADQENSESSLLLASASSIAKTKESKSSVTSPVPQVPSAAREPSKAASMLSVKSLADSPSDVSDQSSSVNSGYGTLEDSQSSFGVRPSLSSEINNLLRDDEILGPFYPVALQRLGRRDFQKLFRELMKEYCISLNHSNSIWSIAHHTLSRLASLSHRPTYK